MVSAINETASISVNAEAIQKNPRGTASSIGDATPHEAAEQVSPNPDEFYGSPEIKKSDREAADYSMTKEATGEIRRSELDNGNLTVKVYDSSGKLLRKIPPGYLPMGEQKFDITV